MILPSGLYLAGFYLATSYLAGALTILSPCILPILPFVFARAGQPAGRGVLPMAAGMVAGFAAVAALAAVGGGWAVQANEVGRGGALALLALFGATLLSPRLAALLSRPLVAAGGRLAGGRLGEQAGASRPATAGGSLLLGLATGLLWTPCAGPVLGLVLTGAALNGANPQTTLLLAAYAAGAATSLALAVLAGGRVMAGLKRSLGPGERVRRGLGAAVLVGVAAIALGLDAGPLARLSYAGTTRVEQALLDRLPAPAGQPGPGEPHRGTPYRSGLPVEGRLPALDGATAWLNSGPLSAEGLRGKVVLVDVWTYSCINCIRTLPYLRAWAETYRDRGLVVIGVHAPEFAFEKNLDNVRRALDEFGITYPVAVDNDFRLWRAFRNSYWPAFYLADAEGRIRHHQFGEGGYERTERAIQELLAEAAGGPEAASPDAASPDGTGGLVAPEAPGAQAAPDLDRLRSGESYIGYDKADGFASPQGVAPDRPQIYTVGALRLNRWGLAGEWTVGAERASLDRPGGAIAHRFSARDLHLVLGPGADGRPVRFQVTIDGQPPGADHGTDTDADGNGVVSGTRLHQLVRQTGAVRERRFEIRFLDAGVQAYAFTFG